MDAKSRRPKHSAGKWIALAVIVTLLLAVAIMVFGYLLPYQNAQSAMPVGGVFTIEQQADGSLMLHWPQADQADYYCVEVLVPSELKNQEPELVYKDYIEGTNSCLLPQLPAGIQLTLRVRSVMEYRSIGGEKIRYGESAMEVTTVYTAPTITQFSWSANETNKTVRMQYQTSEGAYVRFYLLDEQGNVTQTRFPDAESFELSFGDEGDYPMPTFGQSYHMVLDAYRVEEGLKFYGYRSAELTVTRDDLLGRNLNLRLTDEGYNVCSLQWDETKGESYAVQRKDPNSQIWETVAEVAGDGSRTYRSGHLATFQDYTFRVVACGGQTMEDSEYAAVSEEIVFTTGASPIYATIWPTKDLTAYRDSTATESVGTVQTGVAYCVLEEQDGMFAVRLDGQTVYIDSNYCMINLPEYMGDMCRYQITNSKSSLYMVHEFEIPKVTGVVTTGYEKIRLLDGSYLVPLLYPTAQKLVTAAQSAIEQGYRLKIYDAFRPNKATREIYDLTAAILDDELPEKPYTDVSISQLKLPEPQVVTPAQTDESGDAVGEAEKILTYRMVMCSSKYNLGYFLAKGGSMHNLGIALDLTLESLDTGEELSMQTSMHDLSQYSVLSKNNKAAKTLATIMKNAGFGDLVSEWWHFQDNDARSQLSPPSVYNGVNAGCWMADDYGWRYRTQKGNYYAGETVTIDNVSYSFDESGYVVTGKG